MRLRYTNFVTALGDSAPRAPKLGRYELITQIGQGGMAEVQLALQRGPAGFEKLVVVKLVHENLATQKAFVDMLLDEARVAALVKHPNVVDIYDLGEVEGRYFIAMEYLEGEPLLAVLRAGRDGQRLDVLSTARLIADTAEGLDAAHELRSMAGDPIELVHHDISLGNIVVLYNGQVKLVDFGVAKATQSATASTKIQGKFSYMAPEKLRGGPGDRRSDIWSLGCVLWEALTLKRLFKGGNDSDTMAQVLDTAILAPSNVNGDVLADFDAIVLRALERDPSKRYPTAKAMAAEIEEVLRKHGYAAKNDMIARYMQATFESHITARKKLLQEVSSKGRASPDVLEAAFHSSTLASGSHPSSSELLSKRRPAASTARVAPDAGADEAPQVTAELDPRTDGGDTVVEPPRASNKRWLAYPAAAGVIVAVLVMTTLVAGRRPRRANGPAPAAPALVPPEAKPAAIVSAAEPHAPLPAPPSVDAPATPDLPPIALPSPAASPSPGAPPPPVQSVELVQIEPEATTAKPARSPARHPAPRSAQLTKPASDKINPDEVYKAGLQAWVFGDVKTALASYKRVLQANPTYSAAWRGIGLVYERLGDKPAARSAFLKYLQLAPGAADAPEIRGRLGSP